MLIIEVSRVVIEDWDGDGAIGIPDETLVFSGSGGKVVKNYRPTFAAKFQCPNRPIAAHFDRQLLAETCRFAPVFSGSFRHGGS